VLRILLNAEPLDVLTDYTAPKGTPVVITPLGELLLLRRAAPPPAGSCPGGGAL